MNGTKMSLADLVRDGNVVMECTLQQDFLVRVGEDPRVYLYTRPKISPTGKYCDAGTRCWAESDMGDWIPCEDVELIEEFASQVVVRG